MMPTPLTMPNSVVNPWLPRQAVIEHVHSEAPGVWTYRLSETSSNLAVGYHFQPGQFNMLYLPGFGEVAISLSGPPPSAVATETVGGWVHTIRQAGQVTGAITRLLAGDRLAIRGPYGKPWPVADWQASDVILMAGGIGLAPLRPVIYQLLARRGDYGRLILLYGARMADGLLYQAEYPDWIGAGWEIHLTVDRATAGWNGSVGVVPRLLDRIRLPRPQETVILSCGPELMMRYAALGAIARGVPPQNIWVSLERHMQCAVGLCGHCQLGTTLVCRDGPVFRWDRAQPLFNIHDL